MSSFTMKSYSSETTAQDIINILQSAISSRGCASLAIPGGGTPLPILQDIAQLLSNETKEKVRLLWVDERAVPEGNQDRNDKATLAAWEQGGSRPGAVYPMLTGYTGDNPDEELKKECQRYKEIVEKQETECGGGIDVCLIGIGPDGHIASLFPNHELLDDNSAPVLSISDSPKPPPRRVTLSLDVVRRAHHRVVVIKGEQKGQIWKQVQQGTSGKQLPISLLPKENTVWYIDSDAEKAASS
eukprot:gb/GECH01012742.1/.p1 GENE.gb/GECH01012742.1/~~gb/GECH01012742.1/.p1  ORF type:complete len:242 (+),score=56.20 gb/GECH01012742.1/:1-726(+)